MQNKKTYNQVAAEYQALLEKKIALKEKMVQLEEENFGILNSFIKDEVNNS
jgi:hypothetical protein